MFYFMENVSDLKAWQLYLGNAFWTLFVGLLILVIAKVLGLVGLETDAIDNLLHRIGGITEARDPQMLFNLARGMNPHNTAAPAHYS